MHKVSRCFGCSQSRIWAYHGAGCNEPGSSTMLPRLLRAPESSRQGGGVQIKAGFKSSGGFKSAGGFITGGIQIKKSQGKTRFSYISQIPSCSLAVQVWQKGRLVYWTALIPAAHPVRGRRGGRRGRRARGAASCGGRRRPHTKIPRSEYKKTLDF